MTSQNDAVLVDDDQTQKSVRQNAVCDLTYLLLGMVVSVPNVSLEAI